MGDDGELLAARFERGDGGVTQQCGGACRDGACEGRADIRAKEPSVGDGASDESGFEGAAEGFDFREFWHGMVDAATSEFQEEVLARSRR
jgi:hypothetical protein